MLDVMIFTAKTVSEITVNKDAKSEILGYNLEKFDGEVTASFSKLLEVENTNSSASNTSGTFSRLFHSKASSFNQEQEQGRSQSASALPSDLEDYLKKNNMVLYGPYLAENHLNSNKPITVSFDPLDGSKVSNIGYMFVPKQSQGSSANNGGIDSPSNIDNYELVEVSGVDDNYAHENPTLFVIVDDEEDGGGGSSSGGGGSGTPSGRDIDCRDLTDDDIFVLKMPEFRLTDNFSWAPWDRNFVSLWVATGSLAFSGGEPVLSANVNQHWGRKQVSRENGRNKTWINSDIPYFESKWEDEELEIFYVFTRKESSKISITGKVEYSKDGLTASVDVNIGEQDKEKVITKQNLNRCLYLARHTRDLGFGTRNGEAIYRWDKLEFYLMPDISNIND